MQESRDSNPCVGSFVDHHKDLHDREVAKRLPRKFRFRIHSAQLEGIRQQLEHGFQLGEFLIPFFEEGSGIDHCTLVQLIRAFLNQSPRSLKLGLALSLQVLQQSQAFAHHFTGGLLAARRHTRSQELGLLWSEGHADVLSFRHASSPLDLYYIAVQFLAAVKFK